MVWPLKIFASEINGLHPRTLKESQVAEQAM